MGSHKTLQRLGSAQIMVRLFNYSELRDKDVPRFAAKRGTVLPAIRGVNAPH